MTKFIMSPWDAIKLVASRTFRPMNTADFMGYAGATEGGLIHVGDDYIIIVDSGDNIEGATLDVIAADIYIERVSNDEDHIPSDEDHVMFDIREFSP